MQTWTGLDLLCYRELFNTKNQLQKSPTSKTFVLNLDPYHNLYNAPSPFGPPKGVVHFPQQSLLSLLPFSIYNFFTGQQLVGPNPDVVTKRHTQQSLKRVEIYTSYGGKGFNLRSIILWASEFQRLVKKDPI